MLWCLWSCLARLAEYLNRREGETRLAETGKRVASRRSRVRVEPLWMLKLKCPRYELLQIEHISIIVIPNFLMHCQRAQ